MINPIKATLLSALVLPGAGHLYLKSRGRGLTFIALTLACLTIIIMDAVDKALIIVKQLDAEGGLFNISRITELALQSSQNAYGGTVATAIFGLILCWLVAMVDAYRLGRKSHLES